MKTENYKIELSHEGFHFGEYRYYWYRIVPSELPLFKRLFCNRWKALYHFKYLLDFEKLNYLYSKEEYYNELTGLKTLSDVREYLNKQDELKEAAKKDALEKKEIWPD